MVSRAKAGLFFSQDTLTPTLAGLPQYLDKAMAAATKYYEMRIESDARTNAPWQDRTGNARSGLKATSGRETLGVWFIVLFHRVPYGIWLEVANEGQYAIIMKTLNEYNGRILSRLSGLLDRMQEGAR